jgi:hypothetical protein
MDIAPYFKKFDPITLFLLGLVWWNIHQDIVDIDKRLTRIETVMLLENRLPSHFAEKVIKDKTA